MAETITIEAQVVAPIGVVWDTYVDPEAVRQWNAASHDWHTTVASNRLEVGGGFCYRMEAKDGSTGFDFAGTYVEVVPHEKIVYKLDDVRVVSVVFESEGESTKVIVTYVPETENSLELQRQGWQAILDNFKKYTESLRQN